MTAREIADRISKVLSECNDFLDDVTYDRNPYVTTAEMKEHARMGALIAFHNAMVSLLHDIREATP